MAMLERSEFAQRISRAMSRICVGIPTPPSLLAPHFPHGCRHCRTLAALPNLASTRRRGRGDSEERRWEAGKTKGRRMQRRAP
eukprot:1614381-Pyramimonas_sp.AAC.1